MTQPDSFEGLKREGQESGYPPSESVQDLGALATGASDPSNTGGFRPERPQPSPLPREAKFYDPTTTPEVDAEGALNLYGYNHAECIARNREKFSWDASPYLPPEHNRILDGYWLVGNDEHDRRRPESAPWFHERAAAVMTSRIARHR